MSNYKIITDEAELDRFIEFLPELAENEGYYISLMSRSKYLKGTEHEKTMKGDREKLKRAVATDKKRIKQKIRQMETAVGTYDDDRGNEIPQKALALYISVNPRNLRLAAHKLQETINSRLYQGESVNPFTESLRAIQMAKSTRHFLEFDFDVDKTKVSLDTIANEIFETTGLSREHLSAVETNGGYHIFINTAKLKGMKVNWKPKFDVIHEKYSSDTDARGEHLTPVPGTHQGGFTPRLFVF